MLHQTELKDSDLTRNRNSQNDLNALPVAEPEKPRSKSTVLTRALQEMNQSRLFNSYEVGANYQ